MVRLTLALLVHLSFAQAFSAPPGDRVLGLLSLPDVFGDGPCDRFTPRDVLLYPAPESDDVIGRIRVDRNWTYPPEGGCEGLAVNVHRGQDHPVAAFPTREYEYEAPAAIVLQQRGRWFKVRLEDGAAWVHASARDRFFPLEELLKDNETAHRTEFWDGRLAEVPGGTLVPVKGDPRRHIEYEHLRAVDFRRVGGELWIEVELLSGSFCESNDPTVTARGWMPAHGPTGEPAIWFSSRGC